METQEELKKPIGKLEPERTRLKPAKVKIVNVKIEKTAKAKKVVFEVLHPDKKDFPIKISSLAYIEDKKVKVTGTWYNLDKEENLQKNSALVILLQRLKANTIEEAIDKEIETDFDGDYLCFKAY